MRVAAWLVSVVLLGACSSSLEYAPRPLDDVEPPPQTGADVRLDSVTPHYGPNSGGTEVTLIGTFDETAEAWFDDVQGTVLNQTATELLVETPAVDTTGWVRVEVRSGTQSARLPHSFQYWPDETGLTGTLGSVNLFDNIGGYWEGGPRDFAIGQFAFTTQTDWELYMEYAPAIGSCRLDWVSGSDATFVDPAASLVQFTAPSPSFVLPSVSDASGDPWFIDTVMSTTAVQAGRVYDLEPVRGAPDWPGFGLPGAISMPASFTVRTPDLAATSAPLTDRSIDLEWTGSGGDYALIWILREAVASDGSTFVDGVVTCAVPDTGAFTVPPSTWTDWFAGDFLHIQVGRVITDTNVLPHTNASSRVAGVLWVYGGAQTR